MFVGVIQILEQKGWMPFRHGFRVNASFGLVLMLCKVAWRIGLQPFDDCDVAGMKVLDLPSVELFLRRGYGVLGKPVRFPGMTLAIQVPSGQLPDRVVKRGAKVEESFG